MKQTKTQQIIPAIIMASAATVPVVTTAEILTHGVGRTNAAGLPAAPVAIAPTPNPARPASPSPPATAGGTHTFQGPAINDPFGTVQAAITVVGHKISNVAITAPQDNFRSAGINQQAVPMLQSETLQAQNAQISLISGATLTSEAYIQSLQGALDQARSQGYAVS